MATDAQMNANRANAQHSTGPRTEEGKARSSRNAVIHGLTGQSPQLPGEPTEQFETTLEDYREHLCPVGPIEETLVYRMAVATQRIVRGRRIEIGLFDIHMRILPLPLEGNEDGKADPVAWAWSVDSRDKCIDRIIRYAKNNQREWDNCQGRLEKLQNQRRKRESEEPWESNPCPPSPDPCSPAEEQASPCPPAEEQSKSATKPNRAQDCEANPNWPWNPYTEGGSKPPAQRGLIPNDPKDPPDQN